MKMVAVGGVLSFLGFTEYQDNSGATDEPVSISVSQLEQGVEPTSSHVVVGDHAAAYDGMIYFSHSDNEAPETPVSYCLYPIVALSNPYVEAMSEFVKRANQDPQSVTMDEYEKIALDDFTIVVQTRRFKTYGDLPYLVDRCESVQGMLSKKGDSLDAEERKLFQEAFPKVDLDKVVVLREAAKPTSPAASLGMMGGGGLLALIGLAGIGKNLVA